MAEKELLILPISGCFKNKNILDIIPYDGQFLIKTKKDAGFYLFNNYTISEFKTDADKFIEQNVYTSAVEINNYTYAIGTEMGGIILINKKGKHICTINESCGLFSLNINQLYLDKNNTLWALHNQALSRIEINSPYRYFNKNHGLKGNVSSVIRFKEKLYVATSQGLFYWHKEENNDIYFRKIPQIKSNCFDFHVLGDQLFISSSNGIYEINETKATLFYNREAEEIISVLHSKKNPDLIFLGQKNGISALRYIEGILIIEKKIEGINNAITSIAEDSDGTLWLTSNFNEVYRINPFEKYSPKLQHTLYNLTNKLPKNLEWIHLYSINTGVLFSTSKGIYRFNYPNENFYVDTLLGVDFTKESTWVYPIVEDSENNLWFNIIEKKDSKNLTLVKYYKKDSVLELQPLPLNRIKDLFISSISPDNNGIIWFGGFEGLISYDLNKEVPKKHSIELLFSKITIGKDSVIYQLPIGEINRSEQKNVYHYGLNNILFDFSYPDYESEDHIYYQYHLNTQMHRQQKIHAGLYLQN